MKTKKKLDKAQIELIRNWLRSCGATKEQLDEFDKMASDYLSGKREDIPLWKIIKIGD